ncbi:hypothetical protein ALC60_05982 [Trachymyrmex zeteki]|uniref:Uncharacterized protein n=1 Tax=Mycetomoellerius zeteki TaxID=64791 RepID=A0A151X4C9_9HYME|nr:hypothetical protein ALC60_05982 [Trachymyrmex zeteki]
MLQLRSQFKEFTSVEPIAMRLEIVRERSFGCIIALECSVMGVGINNKDF